MCAFCEKVKLEVLQSSEVFFLSFQPLLWKMTLWVLRYIPLLYISLLRTLRVLRYIPWWHVQLQAWAVLINAPVVIAL